MPSIPAGSLQFVGFERRSETKQHQRCRFIGADHAYITANVGTTFSATAISNYLKNEGRTVAPETIINYIKTCEDAFLFY